MCGWFFDVCSRCVLFVAGCLLFAICVVCDLMYVMCCVCCGCSFWLFVDCCALCVVRCSLLLVGCRLLVVVYSVSCLLFVVRWLCVVCCLMVVGRLCLVHAASGLSSLWLFVVRCSRCSRWCVVCCVLLPALRPCVHSLSVVCCVVFDVYCWLFAVRRLSFVVCFCIFACVCVVAWSLLVVVYYWFGFVLGCSWFVGVCCL